MKSFVLFIFVLSVSLTAYCKDTLIPDPNFEQALIDLGYDSGPLDGKVLKNTLFYIEIIDLSNKDIKDLTGIKDFYLLKTLVCSDNFIETLDLTRNRYLTNVVCDNNKLTDIDVSGLSNLTTLNVSNNYLKDLYVHSNRNLTKLFCESNLLTTMYLSRNQKLQELVCINNNLTCIDVTAHKATFSILCDDDVIIEEGKATSPYIILSAGDTIQCDSLSLNALSILKTYANGEVKRYRTRQFLGFSDGFNDYESGRVGKLHDAREILVNLGYTNFKDNTEKNAKEVVNSNKGVSGYENWKFVYRDQGKSIKGTFK